MTPPVFILAPHRSFTSITCAMLGQHPELLGVPELNLCIAERMRGWWLAYSAGRGIGASGLVRTVAQVYFGAQTEEAAELARAWIGRRLDRSTSSVFRELAAELQPRALVDKSPLNARPVGLARLDRAFPRARYLHLVRDPVTRAQSVTAALPQFDLPVNLVDPIEQWYSIHTGVLGFLEGLPRDRWMRLHGEHLMADPASTLRQIAAWLGVGTDVETIDEMLHPERSPFATFGPPSAPLGNDVEFLRRPELRRDRGRRSETGEADGWATGMAELPHNVRELAVEFGYE